MEIGSGGETEMDYSYRTELLSPTPSTGDQSSWRLDIDKFRLPQRHSSAQPFGFRRLLRIPSISFHHIIDPVFWLLNVCACQFILFCIVMLFFDALLHFYKQFDSLLWQFSLDMNHNE